ncbi:aminodeoxychorismate synthase component I [Rosettibacter firmus]|uniref:aminodeoxychorismate synthase component I n=1 Tax=Rosettibacter firmus TaxID=3111522 RepID=UPI00336C02DF
MINKNKIYSAIELMNNYGRNRIPFLFIIDFDMNSPIILPQSDLMKEGILFEINNTKKKKYHLNKKIEFEKYPISFSDYKKIFEKVYDEIYAGNTYLINLTLPTRIKTNLSLHEIYLLSDAKYKLLYKNKFVVFSPETFVTIKDGLISSYPMKGTIDASIPDAEQILLSDEKEIAEHNTIVDLIRNDLSMVSKNVRVEKFRYIDKLITNDKTLLQVSSKIVGELEKNYNEKIGEIIFTLLPAGSISGAPKRKTVEIIHNVEIDERGYYTGIFGVFDGIDLESAVMIRFIENKDGEFIYRSGGGITFMSNPYLEYQELIDKVYVPIN